MGRYTVIDSDSVCRIHAILVSSVICFFGPDRTLLKMGCSSGCLRIFDNPRGIITLAMDTFQRFLGNWVESEVDITVNYRPYYNGYQRSFVLLNFLDMKYKQPLEHPIFNSVVMVP